MAYIGGKEHGNAVKHSRYLDLLKNGVFLQFMIVLLEKLLLYIRIHCLLCHQLLMLKKQTIPWDYFGTCGNFGVKTNF